MATELGMNIIILIVSFGVLSFVMVFFFAKRQISRFSLKSSRGPHGDIGKNAPEVLVLEIERRLRRAKDIVIEPHLIGPGLEEELKFKNQSESEFYYYRMKALDNIFILYNQMKICNPSSIKKPSVPLRVFLIDQRQLGCLEGIRIEIIEKFCDLYEHARYEQKSFKHAEYVKYQDLLKLLLHYIKTKQKSKKSPLTSRIENKNELSLTSVGSVAMDDNKKKNNDKKKFGVFNFPKKIVNNNIIVNNTNSTDTKNINNKDKANSKKNDYNNNNNTNNNNNNIINKNSNNLNVSFCSSDNSDHSLKKLL